MSKPEVIDLPRALTIIRTIHAELLDFRHPEFDLVAQGKEGEFDDRVKAVLSHSAEVIKADRAALAYEKGREDYRLGNDPGPGNPGGNPDYTDDEDKAWNDGWNYQAEFGDLE